MTTREVYSITAPTLVQVLEKLERDNENEVLYLRNPKITIEQDTTSIYPFPGFTAVIELDAQSEEWFE